LLHHYGVIRGFACFAGFFSKLCNFVGFIDDARSIRENTCSVAGNDSNVSPRGMSGQSKFIITDETERNRRIRDTVF
jgi:hypothetical protein